MKRVIILLVVAFSGNITAQEKTPEEWVEQIKSDTRNEKPSDELKTLRLAAGVYITHGAAGSTAEKSRYPESAKVLKAFMKSRGKSILGKILTGEKLGESEKQYRLIVLGCYLKAGADGSESRKKKGSHNLYLQEILVPDESALKKAVEYKNRIEKQGPLLLTKAYLERKLSEEEVDIIHQNRILQGTRGVGETFLPMHLGLNPLYATGRIQGGSHGFRQIEQEMIGREIYKFRLPTLEAVRMRDTFTDTPNPEYGYMYPFLPEGVLEFLEPVTGYEKGEINGKPAVFVKKEFQVSPSDTDLPEKQVLLSELAGEKPLFLFVNDAVDAPLTRAFNMIPTLMKAYKDQVNFYYVQVNIHDWFYASKAFKDYLEKPRWYNQHHSWSEEEKARRISMRLVQMPHNDEMNILIDSNYHFMKDRYASGGGQNSYWLFGKDGIAVHKSGGAFLPMGKANEMEYALSRLINRGGTGKIEPSSEVYCLATEDPVLVFEKALIKAVEGNVITISVTGTELTVELTSHSRIAVDTLHKEISDLKPEQTAVLQCRLSDNGFTGEFEWPKPVPGWSKEKRFASDITIGGLSIKAYRRSHGYTIDHDVLLAESVEGSGMLKVFSISAFSKPEINLTNALAVPGDVIWRGGIVTGIDKEKQILTIKPWSYNKEKLDGRRILKQWRDDGRKIYLDDITKARHASVNRWIESEGKDVSFFCDDAVVYTLNGRFTASFKDIQKGDNLTVRYRVQYDNDDIINASMVRISRIGKK